MNKPTRRRFLQFLGRTSAASWALAATGCKEFSRSNATTSRTYSSPLGFTPLEPTREDALVLADGFEYYEIAREGVPVNGNNELFGLNPDYIATLPLPGDSSPSRRIMWVNHEYPVNGLLHGLPMGARKTKQQVEQEQLGLGGSLMAIEKDTDGKWSVIPNHPTNRRISGQTPIPFVADRPIEGATRAVGTMGNCAGGFTPWGTFLTCEENYANYYGEHIYEPDGTRRWVESGLYAYHWQEHFKRPPEHYGWVVEVDPKSGNAKKLTSIGRFAHESATVTQAKDGRCVVYSGDDKKFGSFYKFVAEKPGSLERGTLYVANLDSRRWEPLTLERSELRSKFKDQTEVLIRAREAALLVGGSQLDRPEDIEVDPATGAVLVAFSNNNERNPPNHHGSIMKFVERDNDPLATGFEWSVFVAGGPASGLSCPDNLAFDPAGNLWLANDISGAAMDRPFYKDFGNNALFVVPMRGPNAGEPIRVASCPTEAEMTGLCFAPDGQTLFASIQHPGEFSPPGGGFTSTWPKGGKSKPLSAVVAIRGPAFRQLVSV